jgi:prolyl-tRNA editing enzyme YbaK/EbsC (Cys-tRNA(Pro) deacylase)
MSGAMSAFGPKQTLAIALHESAFGSKADITNCGVSAFSVAIGGKADMPYCAAYVCF